MPCSHPPGGHGQRGRACNDPHDQRRLGRTHRVRIRARSPAGGVGAAGLRCRGGACGSSARTGDNPAALHRNDIVAFCNRLGARTHSHIVRDVALVLTRIRTLGLTHPGQVIEGLPPDFRLR